MIEITAFNTVAYGFLFGAIYFFSLSIYLKKFISIQLIRLLTYITLFSLLGISGEIFVNTIYTAVFDKPLWEYRLFPAHNGHISYFFIFIWGSLGFYKYLNDTELHPYKSKRLLIPGLIMGAEAILLELMYNGLFLMLFGEYIFYYLPANLGPLSHLSCLQVIPFYFIVGFVITLLLRIQDKIGYNKYTLVNLTFYWMIIATFLML